MKINRLHRVSALLMSLFMLASTVGLTIDFHYCGGELQSFTLVGKAQKCDKGFIQGLEISQNKQSHACCRKKNSDSKSQTTPCHQSDQKIKSGKCCHNKTIHVENDVVDQQLLAQDVLLKLLVVDFVNAFHYNYSPPVSQQEHFFRYKSPPIVTDANIQYQVFRI